ncbi:MAG TPA: hypothetical protein VM077_00545 [Candidatus Limnocylindrales bacterium]|nr:hypothetical protein [Candidatus Limnocylindrales bacterium]
MDIKYAGKSDETVKKATGKSWSEWFNILDSADASKMIHKDIVSLLREKGYAISWWWIQSIVVGYEQKIGRRVVGQIADGNFSTATSLTLEGTMDGALMRWEALVKDKSEFNKVKIKGEPRISSTDRWRYWKVDLEDDSKINVDISEKGKGKIGLSVTHYKLPDKKATDKWKEYWREFLTKT